MSNYHEPVNELSEEARNFTKALNSLKEEIEAVDWYHQRVDTSNDQTLKQILAHNRDEEIEHACMALEWLRRNMPGWDEELRNWLFREGDIVHEEQDGDQGETDTTQNNDLGIGQLK
ncbi:MAG: encapsulin-associated ferritin-like protein [Bacteroidota bacterium]